MPSSLYVKNIPPEITKEKLIIYFQSSKSGGGDVDTDASEWNGDNAVVVFEEEEYLESVLKRKHEIYGYQLEISHEPFKQKPIPKKRTKTPGSKTEEKSPQLGNEKAYLGEVRTVIVSGLSPNTTDQALELFFENERRTGGGKIEKLERCQPDVAHITFDDAKVAARVLEHDKLEFEGYLLKLKEKQPELFLPPDNKKLYVENLNPKTTKDSLLNYIEVIAKVEVCDVEFGENKSALVTFNEEPDLNKILKKKKSLDGADLKISKPPVCNSVLVTGLTKNTTKNTIEMYFECYERSGGGKIYGDVIYQKNKRTAVVSFCDPKVVQSVIAKEQKLNGYDLYVRQHYQFMKKITEKSSDIIKVNTAILKYVVKNYHHEIRERFGDEILEVFNENKEELMVPSELAKDVEEYLKEYTVKEVQFCKKLLDTSREKLKLITTAATKENIAIEMQEERLQIQLIGKKKYVEEIFVQLKHDITELEKELDVVTEQLNMQGYKLELFLLHGVDEMLTDKFHVDVKIEPRKEVITIKGPEKYVSFATKEALKNGNQIMEENIDLNETKKRFVASGGLELLNNGMKAKGLKGIVSVNQSKKNKAKVLVINDGTCSIEDVQSYLNSNMFIEEYDLDQESLSLLKSNKWEEFCENARKETSVGIYSDERSSTKITLIGKKSMVKEIYKALEDFMKHNTIVKKRLDLGEGYVGYLSEYCLKDLEEMEKQLEEHSVRLCIVEHEDHLDVQGTKEGVKETIKRLEDIISNIATDKMSVDKLRSQEYLESDEGIISLEGIEAKHKCLIRLIKVDGEKSAIIPSTRPKQTSKLLCSYETQENILLKVFKDDITEHGCDVIVNAANGDLKHIGGLAKNIVDAGGEEIQKECDDHVKREGKLYDGECFSGRPGKLPCKRLIHAVGPRWDNSESEKTCTTLKVTCTKTLDEAKNFRSIAIPAIGSGVFGIPKDICADIMIEAAEEFGKKYDSGFLKEIHFVNIDDTTSQVFLKKFRERFGSRSSFKDSQGKAAGRKFASSRVKEKMREEKDITFEAVPRRKPGDFITTKGGMKILVAVGDLSTYKADILVNTTGKTLQLDSNPCGKALSNEAGPTLQAECTKIGKLRVGQVAATLGGNLLCDEVYHVVCVQWNGGEGEQVLRTIIKNCLKMCSSSGKKSIAFPAIGTGILGFPHDVAAKIFFEETKEFEKRIKNSSIKEVSFVVYNQDTTSIEAFKSELKKQAEWGSRGFPSTVPVATEPKKLRKKRRSTNPPLISQSSFYEAPNSMMCIQVGEDKEIEIVKGDITKETTDVIAHLTNPGMSLQSGVARALTRVAGQIIERECQDFADSNKIQIAETVLTKAGRLNAKYIAHMIASNSPSFHEIEKCISNCLKVVNEKECESVSFPAVGTGSLNHDPEKAATAILTTVMRFLGTSPGPLKIVRIVLNDDNLLSAFHVLAKKLNENEDPGVLKRIANFFWKSDSTAISVKEKAPVVIKRKLFLEIYAKDKDTVSRVKGKLEKVIESQNNKKEKIEDECIGKLSQHQIIKIKSLCEMNDVKVTIEQQLNRIVVVGHADDISKMLSDIYKYLKKISEEEKEKEKVAWNADLAEIVSQGVQWYWEDTTSGDYEEYDKQTNVTIEKAYSKKDKSVIFLLDDGKCEIVFKKMEETNLDKNETIKVIRKDLKAEVSLPEYWEAQPVDANGKDSTVHLALLNPNDPKHKEEYKKVSDHFLQTASQHRIVQIQRLQNPSLYRQYLMKKRSLDEKSGSNEKFLFHGTASNKLSEINEKGLNRSYAGSSSGVAFGKGVYFARDALMSAGYAPAMFNGHRYMYYARAAVGQYALGNSSMIVPPSKGGNTNDSYDSTVNNLMNPTIFVLFYDSQYYPEYLITFT